MLSRKKIRGKIITQTNNKKKNIRNKNKKKNNIYKEIIYCIKSLIIHEISGYNKIKNL